MKKVFLVLLTVFVAIWAFAEVKNPDTFISLTIGEPETLDPHWMYDTASGEVVLNAYDNLIRYDGESLTDFLPMIATEVPTLENGLIKDGGATYIFPIREGIKFHSGNELTPYDVEYSFERGMVQDRAGGPQWMIIEALSGGDYSSIETWFKDYSGMAYSDAVDENKEAVSDEAANKLVAFFNEVIDPLVEVDGNNVVFNMKGPFAPFMQIIAHYAGWSAIVDSQYVAELGGWDGNPSGWWKYHDPSQGDTVLHTQDAGSGAYKVVNWDRTQQRVTLERFDDYWMGQAPLKNVVIWGVDEYSTRKSMLEAGDADIVYVPVQYRDQVIDLEGVRVIEGYPAAQTTTFFMNWEVAEDSEYLGSGKLDGNGIPKDFFGDIHVRRAFRHCYNAEVFINEVLYGLGDPIPTDLPIGYLGYSEELPVPEFSLKKATEEFKKAFDGKVWENGFEITLLYNTGNDIRQTVCEMLKFYIEQINPKFKVNVNGVQWPTFLAASLNGLQPAYTLGWLADYADPHNFIATYYASYGTFGQTYGEPFKEFARENLDPLIEEAVKTPDPEKRKELYLEIQEIAIEQALTIPLYNPTGFHVERTWVKGWYPHSLRSGPWYYVLDKAEE